MVETRSKPAPKTEKKKINFHISPELARWLQERAAREHRSLSDLIRHYLLVVKEESEQAGDGGHE